MENQLCVSSYSFRWYLGPIKIDMRDQDGKKEPIVVDAPRTMDLLELPRQVKERLGVDAMEICQFQLPKSEEYIRKLRRALDDAGVSVVNVTIDTGNISDANDAFREEDLADIEEWLKLVAALGSPMVRVNASPYLPGAWKAKLAPLEVTIDSLRRLGGTARDLGMQLVLENHDGITITPEVCIEILDAVGPSLLKSLVDTGNFNPVRAEAMSAIFEGRDFRDVDDPTATFEAVAKLAPRAVFVHAKCHGLHPDGRSKVYDIRRALHILRDVGYTGPISLEQEATQADSSWETIHETLTMIEHSMSLEDAV